MKAIQTILAATTLVLSGASTEEWQPMTPERHAHIQSTKSQRMAERRERVRKALATPGSKLNRLSDAEMADITTAAVNKEVIEASVKGGQGWEDKVSSLKTEGGRALEGEEHQWIRRVNVDAEKGRALWGNGNSNYDPYASNAGLAPETQYYDKWQQAYRFLGGFIDCDHSWSQGSHDRNDNHNNNNNNNQGGKACSRWMMWAAYIDPNYAGGGYGEYFGEDAPGSLDCHSPDSDWVLIGVYRQEFYQYIEQISKHLWAIDEYEYIVALAGLKYMTKNECFGVGYDENGNQLYAAVRPTAGGRFEMGLYSDTQCLYLNTETAYTYDDFGEKSDLYLGSKDNTDDDAFHYQAYQYWYDTQEYTFENLNTVYHDYRFCTSCVDYPTYQDGYFIGDDGKDDEDLINQCWKFYSHDSFNCDADCIAMGAAQGTITWINYNGRQFGSLIEDQYSQTHEGTRLGDSGTVTQSSTSDGHRLERLKANLFLTVAGIVFVATFLAFAVARGSSKKKVKSTSRSRSRRLLDEDHDETRRSSRSTSARSAKSRSKSRSGMSTSGKSRSKSRSRVKGDYVPPSESGRSSDRERRSSDEKKRRSSSKKRVSSSRRDEF